MSNPNELDLYSKNELKNKKLSQLQTIAKELEIKKIIDLPVQLEQQNLLL